jgi:hypothetical protein
MVHAKCFCATRSLRHQPAPHALYPPVRAQTHCRQQHWRHHPARHLHRWRRRRRLILSKVRLCIYQQPCCTAQYKIVLPAFTFNKRIPLPSAAITCNMTELPLKPGDVRWLRTNGWETGCDGVTPGHVCRASCALPIYTGPGYTSTCSQYGSWSDVAGNCVLYTPPYFPPVAPAPPQGMCIDGDLA